MVVEHCSTYLRIGKEPNRHGGWVAAHLHLTARRTARLSSVSFVLAGLAGTNLGQLHEDLTVPSPGAWTDRRPETKYQAAPPGKG